MITVLSFQFLTSYIQRHNNLFNTAGSSFFDLSRIIEKTFADQLDKIQKDDLFKAAKIFNLEPEKVEKLEGVEL